MPEHLSANSLAEAFLYLMVTPCENCKDGPLEGDDARRRASAGEILTLEIPVTCQKCRHESTLIIRLPEGTGVDQTTGLADFNPTPEPSRMIDVAQWLTLFRMIAGQASAAEDRDQGRHLGLEAAQCLEEALKFYEEDNDLPPRSAFFAPGTRQRLDDHPDEFMRQRLLDLRSKLPTKAKMVQSLLPGIPANRKPWWKVW